jgi:hypothetical protein
MKEKLLVLWAVLSLGTLPGDASAQDNAKAKAAATSAVKSTAADQSEVDLRPQYEAAVSKTKDGTVLLSTLNDGTKVFLRIQASKPVEIVVMDNGGKRIPISFATAPGGGCRGRLGKKTNSTITVPCWSGMNKH